MSYFIFSSYLNESSMQKQHVVDFLPSSPTLSYLNRK